MGWQYCLCILMNNEVLKSFDTCSAMCWDVRVWVTSMCFVVSGEIWPQVDKNCQIDWHSNSSASQELCSAVLQEQGKWSIPGAGQKVFANG